MSHVRIIGISGSLRRASFNTGLLRAAVALMPEGAVLEIAAIDEIPLYNADVEASAGVPASVSALKEKIAAADALLLSTPEYNNSVPGVLKNTIDWLSRPPADSQRVFGGRLIAIMGASPGSYGTVQSQTAWLPIVRTLRMQPWFGGRLAVARAGAAFDEAGVLKDDKVLAQLRDFVHGFVQFVGASRSPKSPISA
ncbi:MAG TPA: NADPH-dependent FMN reductase [Steroidobacteraceae bacterium]